MIHRLGIYSLLTEILGRHRPTPAPTPAEPGFAPDRFERTGEPPKTEGRIALDTAMGQYIKDPSFANDGRPIGNRRYMAFGNLREFYLKGFSAEGGELKFANGEIPMRIEGLDPALDGLWAPQVTVQGDRVMLFYTAGKMPPGGLDWPSFRMRVASMPLSEFQAQAEAGRPVTFKDQGQLFTDQTTFGGDPNFAMIDPQLWTNPAGKAFVSYTVVKHGIPGVRPHESFVRYREVDPADPARPIGPDMPMLDGFSKGPHQGVTEAQDIVTIDGQPHVFVSSRAGDINQRVLMAPVGNDLGRLDDAAFTPVLEPGGADWKSDAVGSTSAAVIDGKTYLLYQGMAADKHFNLGWTQLKR